MTDQSLKPCLCGNKYPDRSRNCEQPRLYWVECADCGISGPHCATKERCYDGWNKLSTRTESPAPEEWRKAWEELREYLAYVPDEFSLSRGSVAEEACSWILEKMDRLVPRGEDKP